MYPEPHTIHDNMTDTSSDRETNIGIPQAPDALGLPLLNLTAIHAEQDPSCRILFTPVTRGETDHIQVARPPAAPTAHADEAIVAAEGAPQRRTTTADRGTHLDDFVQTILDRLDGQEARTIERIDALVTAQVTSQNQVERLRRRKRTSQPHDDQDGQQSPRTPVAEDSETRRRGPASVIVGFIDDHSCDSPQDDRNLQRGHKL